MKDREEHLVEAVGRLIGIRNECSCTIVSECGLPDVTVKQAAYLRMIDEYGDVTFSRLAEITRTSKPTVTEMINRCVGMECAYRERCPGRWEKPLHPPHGEGQGDRAGRQDGPVPDHRTNDDLAG